ncbi:MAG: M24 family metallopeptidase [Chloroflexota bacterium]
MDASRERDVFATRIEKVRRMMDEARVDLLIGYSNGQHSMGTLDAVRWLSGFKPMADAAVLLPKDGEPTLTVSPVWDEARARKRSWVEHVVAANDFGTALGRPAAGAKVGFLGMGRRSPAIKALFESQFSAGMTNLDQQLEQLAAVRDELELELTQQATDIAEQGYEHLLETAWPGMREYELAAEVERFVKSLGADDNFLLLCASRQHPAVRAPNDRVLDVGDLIIGEVSPSVRGQFTQICRTAVIGAVSEVQQHHHQLLVESMLAGMSAGRPGVTVGRVVQAMNEAPTAAGFEKYCHPPYMRVRGHGLGLGSTLPGDLSLDNQTPLQAGMTFVIHPNQFLPDTGYLMVGEPVVVTDNGLQPFTKRTPGIDSIS